MFNREAWMERCGLSPTRVLRRVAGLHQLAPNVRVGVMVDAGTPIGSSLKQPIQLRVQVLGRPVDPVEVWKQAWGEPQLKEIEDEEG